MDQEMFSSSLKAFNLTGFYRNKQKEFPRVLNVLHAFSRMSLLINMFASILFIIGHTDDILDCSEAFIPVSVEVLTLTKFLTLLISKDKIYQMMDHCKEVAAKANPADLLPIKSANEFARKFSKLYFISAATTGVTYCLKPVAANLVRYCITRMALHSNEKRQLISQLSRTTSTSHQHLR